MLQNYSNTFIMAQSANRIRRIETYGFPGIPNRKMVINDVHDFSVILGHGKTSLTRALAFVLLDDKIIKEDPNFYGNLKEYGMSVLVLVSSSSGTNMFERRIIKYPRRAEHFFANDQEVSRGSYKRKLMKIGFFHFNKDLYFKHPFSNQLPLSAESLTDFIKERAMKNDLKKEMDALSERFLDTEIEALLHVAHFEDVDRSNWSDELREKMKEFNQINEVRMEKYKKCLISFVRNIELILPCFFEHPNPRLVFAPKEGTIFSFEKSMVRLNKGKEEIVDYPFVDERLGAADQAILELIWRITVCLEEGIQILILEPFKCWMDHETLEKITRALNDVTAQRNIQILLALRTDEKIQNTHVINMNNSDLYPNH
ncbi:unnamed protein product [Caenorhabditis nigoni]